jgi:hypothetical protein
VLAAGLALPAFNVALKVAGFARVWMRIERTSVTRANRQVLAPQRLAQLVNIAARYSLGKDCCLARSMYLGWLLRRRGIPAPLRIGVRHGDGKLDAHAWIELEGAPLNDTQATTGQYALLPGVETSHLSFQR